MDLTRNTLNPLQLCIIKFLVMSLPAHLPLRKTNRSAPSWASSMPRIPTLTPPSPTLLWMGMDQAIIPFSVWMPMAPLKRPLPSITNPMPHRIPSVCKPRTNIMPPPRFIFQMSTNPHFQTMSLI